MKINRVDVQECKSVEKDIIDIADVMRPAISVGKKVAIIKISNGKDRNLRYKFLRVISMTYSTLVHMLLISMLIKYGFALFNQHVDNHVLPFLAVFTNYLGASYSFLMTYITFHKNYDCFVCEFNKHQLLYGPVKGLKTIAKATKIMTRFMTFACMIYAFFYCYILYAGRQELEVMLWPFNFSSTKNTVILFLVFGIHVFYTVAQSYATIAITNCLFASILIEFHFVAKDIKACIEKHVENESFNPDFEKNIDKLRQRHASAVNLTDIANSMIGHFLFSLYACCIPILCFVFYGAIRVELTYFEIDLMTTITGANLIAPALYAVSGAVISAKVSIFTNVLTSTKIGFNVYNLFTLDATAILMLIGTVVTYGVVIIQFAGVPTQQIMGTEWHGNLTR